MEWQICKRCGNGTKDAASGNVIIAVAVMALLAILFVPMLLARLKHRAPQVLQG